MEMLMNPWAVGNVEEFLYFCCPECEHRYQSRSDFENHAVNHHPKAKTLFNEEQDDYENNTTSDNIKVESYNEEINYNNYEDNDDMINYNHNEDEDDIEPETDLDNFTCLLCSKKFPNLLKLAFHMNSIHNNSSTDQGLKCPKCEQFYSSYDNLKDHIKDEHPKTCSICNQEVKNMSAHIRTEHSHDPNKHFKCQECDFKTHTQKNLSQHVFVRHRKDEHKHVCDFPECTKRFPANFLLKQHVEISHSGQSKRHICDKCKSVTLQK